MYFAIQTYLQEVTDRFNQLDEDSCRLVVQDDVKQWNQLLAETARNGLPTYSASSRQKKSCGSMESIPRAQATAVHHAVGREVRDSIEKIGGTMPEYLPTSEKSIAEIKKEHMERLKRKPLMCS